MKFINASSPRSIETLRAKDWRPCALVTGAGGRVGQMVVVELANHYDVIVHYHANRAGAIETLGLCQAAGSRATMITGDLRNGEDIQELVRDVTEIYGSVMLLVNSAANFHQGNVLTTTAETWMDAFLLNLLAPIQLIRELWDYDAYDVGAAVINLLDTSALRPWPTRAAHSLSRQALLTATRLLAAEMAPKVTVNALVLGPVIRDAGTPTETWAHIVERLPMAASVPEGELTTAIRFIANTRSMTGAIIALNGGEHLK